MTCVRCGSRQSGAGATNRFCANCGSTLPVAAPDDHPTYVQQGYQGYVDAGYQETGPVSEPLPVTPYPDPAAGRGWLRHPGTWVIAATALLMAGIVLAAVIVAGGSDDTERPAAAGNPSSSSASAAVTTTTAAPVPVQTVIVVPAAPGTPAITRTVTVAPNVPASSAGSFGDATEVDISYFQQGSAAYFDSPSHNIGCRLVSNGTQAQCTISDYDFSEPGHDCDLGAGVLMDAGSSPTIDCIDNPPYSGGTVLEYGESMTFGSFSCVSRESGVTCVDSYGSGFALSREAYGAF